MKIILVGVSCVGKSTVGKILADKVGYKFFDFDSEVEKYFNSNITFLKRKYRFERTFREKASVVLNKILKENNDNFILAMTPSGLLDSYWQVSEPPRLIEDGASYQNKVAVPNMPKDLPPAFTASSVDTTKY